MSQSKKHAKMEVDDEAKSPSPSPKKTTGKKGESPEIKTAERASARSSTLLSKTTKGKETTAAKGKKSPSPKIAAAAAEEETPTAKAKKSASPKIKAAEEKAEMKEEEPAGAEEEKEKSSGSKKKGGRPAGKRKAEMAIEKQPEMKRRSSLRESTLLQAKASTAFQTQMYHH